jgi:hypothetical protein
MEQQVHHQTERVAAEAEAHLQITPQTQAQEMVQQILLQELQ